MKKIEIDFKNDIQPCKHLKRQHTATTFRQEIEAFF